MTVPSRRSRSFFWLAWCNLANQAICSSTPMRLGKLPVVPIRFCDHALDAGAVVLAIQDQHVIETAALPPVHDDPLDRLLIAQARVEALMAIRR